VNTEKNAGFNFENCKKKKKLLIIGVELLFYGVLFWINELYASRDYIDKLFKQKAGYSLSEYITKVKMEHAEYLISKGEYRNYEISGILGYKKTD